MADAKKCDRCGRFYEGDFEGTYNITTQPNLKTRNYGRLIDLCPICDIALERFMKLETVDIVEAGGRTYSVDCGAKLGCVKKE